MTSKNEILLHDVNKNGSNFIRNYGTESSVEHIAKPPHLSMRKTHEFVAIVLCSSLLALNSGFINSVSLLTSDITVSHTTGNITKSAILLGDGKYFDFIELFLAIPCFLTGSIIATLLLTGHTFYLDRSHVNVFAVGSLFLLASCIAGMNFDNQLYAYLASVACGMQNAMSSKYSGK